MAAARRLRRRGDHAGPGTAAPGAPETSGAPQRRGLAAVRATAFTRRRTRGGHTETAEYAQRRGLVDVALAYVMRDGLLRVSEAAALRWGDVEVAGDGSGRIRIPESKTDQEAERVVLYLGLAAVEALLAIRPEEAGWDGPGPVVGGVRPPELMTAGRWKSPTMPARYTERQEAGRGAVARYYPGFLGWMLGISTPGGGHQT